MKAIVMRAILWALNGQATCVLPVALVSCSGAVYLPRLFVPDLRQQLGSPAERCDARAL